MASCRPSAKAEIDMNFGLKTQSNLKKLKENQVPHGNQKQGYWVNYRDTIPDT